MASSAFKSTTRRDIHASSSSASRSDPPPCPRRSRSRSVSATPRARGHDSLQEDYANTRTNPLFDSAVSPSPPQQPAGTATSAGGGDAPRRYRKREPLKGGGRGGRARSVPVAPQRRHSASAPSADGAGAVRGRRASRARLVTDTEARDAARKLQSWRSRHLISESKQRGIGASCSSQGSTTGVAIWQQNHSTVPVDPVLEIPPEFDPDSAEFISDFSDCATEYRKKDVVEIPLDFDTDAAELDSDSHERARKLRADLAVEEQREQELSRMLKGIVTASNFTETHKKRPRRKSSIERLKVSRHLAEEALNYFEECVSISTMDGTDFSSPEDHQLNSVLNVQPKSNSRFFHKGRSSSQEPHTPADQHGHHEEFDKQTQCSISITGSDVSDGVNFSNTKCHMKFRNNSSEDLDGLDTPRSRSSCFSFTHESVKNVENCDVPQYLGNFGMGNNKELRETRSSYFADDYVSQKVNPDLLKDMATFQNRMQYGGLFICNVRTF
uniref:Uncharacterized protein n=1 Tax=Setaria italica TaxID=4555 RepID=K4AJS7_SETIT